MSGSTFHDVPENCRLEYDPSVAQHVVTPPPLVSSDTAKNRTQYSELNIRFFLTSACAAELEWSRDLLNSDRSSLWCRMFHTESNHLDFIIGQKQHCSTSLVH
ncbi:Uncharacterized protein Rs2_02837 [Raphanus sativus]|nr:Uncharacterized protein Rs2_02837 [Raphanus sativus]